MKGAFGIRHRMHLGGASILVVDDVSTTGQTLNQLARVLKSAGAAIVFAAVYARTAPGDESDPVTYLVNPFRPRDLVPTPCPIW